MRSKPDEIEFSHTFSKTNSGFDKYDESLVNAIQKRWYDLLGWRSYSGNSTGRVVVSFCLHSDGTVSDVRISESSVDEWPGIMCQKAVMDLAPFERWSEEMRKKIGTDCRQLKFAFYYNDRYPRSAGVLALFRAYNKEFVEAIDNEWKVLLVSYKSQPTNGSVTVQFRLKADGSVADADLVENTIDTANGSLCLKAVAECAPYACWTRDMRQKIGADFRVIKATFHYR